MCWSLFSCGSPCRSRRYCLPFFNLPKHVWMEMTWCLQCPSLQVCAVRSACWVSLLDASFVCQVGALLREMPLGRIYWPPSGTWGWRESRIIFNEIHSPRFSGGPLWLCELGLQDAQCLSVWFQFIRELFSFPWTPRWWFCFFFCFLFFPVPVFGENCLLGVVFWSFTSWGRVTY